MAMTDMPSFGADERRPLRRRASLTSNDGRIPIGVAVVLCAAWLTAIPVTLALEPAPTDADATLPWYGVLIGYVFLTSLLLTAVGLGARQRGGIVASMVAAGVFLLDTVACPVTGHHGFGTWWLGELAVALALVAVSAIAFVSTTPPPKGIPASKTG